MSKVVLVFSFIFAPSAFATKIAYHRGRVQYMIERTGNQIHYRAYDDQADFKIRPCSRKLYQSFWRELVRATHTLPSQEGREPADNYIAIDGHFRLLMPPSPPQ